MVLNMLRYHAIVRPRRIGNRVLSTSVNGDERSSRRGIDMKYLAHVNTHVLQPLL
jgi:hypothetical protein